MGHKLSLLCVWAVCGVVAQARAQDGGTPTVPAKAVAPAPVGAEAVPEVWGAGAPAGETAGAGTGTDTVGEMKPVVAQGPDLSVVRSDLATVMDELIAARARVSVLSKALFNTPLSVRVVRRADEQRLEHITLRLDGVPVHDSEGASLARGEADLFQGFAAPGVHEIAIEVTEVSKTNADYRYVRSERFQIEIKKGMRTRVELVLRDKSNMAEDLKDDDEGEYDVRTLMRVEAESVKD